MKKIKNKNKYSFYSEQLYKFAVVLVVISIFLGVFDVGKTFAYFSSTATMSGNTFTAGVLDVGVSGANISGIVTPGGSATTTVLTLSKTSLTNLDYQYVASTTVLSSGDPEACSYITMLASNSSQTYYGALKDFVSATSTPVGPAAWNFTFTVASGVPTADLGKTCHFKISFSAWQTNLPNASQGFSDVVEVNESIQVGVAPVVPPPSTPPTPPVVPGPGDVVINELMWMGSDGKTGDEWLELRNTKNVAMDIGGWQLTKKNSSGGEVLMFIIPAGKTIVPNGFFLISEYDKAHSAINVTPDLVIGAGDTDGDDFALANDKLQIKLYKSDWTNAANIIDTADDGAGNPAAGDNETLIKKSMERNSTPGDGTLAGSWHTCTDSGCNSGIYWDTAGGNYYGTPGGPNLSANDPTAPDYDPSLSGDEVVPAQQTDVTEQTDPTGELQPETIVDNPDDTEISDAGDENPTADVAGFSDGRIIDSVLSTSETEPTQEIVPAAEVPVPESVVESPVSAPVVETPAVAPEPAPAPDQTEN